MNLKTEPVTIGGILFETTQFPAMRSYALLTRLVKAIGPAMSILAAADKELRLEDMGPILGSALANVTPAEAQGILLEALSCTTAEITDATGGRVIGLTGADKVDLVFSGRLKVMFQVFAHALKVNYSDFSEGSDQDAPEKPVGSS